MKKIIIILFIVSLYANDYELKLYETIFKTLFNKRYINLYIEDNKKDFRNSKILKLTNCKNADVVLVYNLSKLKCKNKPFFVTSYLDFIHSKAIGAFYWKKGRPQLILNKKMIEYYRLNLDKSLIKYAK